MNVTIYPGKLRGTLEINPSKSQAHRLMILAAFGDKPTRLLCGQSNRDMDATADCLRALGAGIERGAGYFLVTPVVQIPGEATLCCRDSGSTLRFLLPVAAALGVDARFRMEGRLPARPLSPLWEEMERMGCRLERPEERVLRCTGKLKAGTFTLDGGVSSQFLTGLMLAAPLMEGETRIRILGKLQSRPYVDMTCQALSLFGIPCRDFTLQGGEKPRSPGELTVEGDWSTAAFFLAANALGSSVTLTGLLPDSAQGDRAAAELLPALGQGRQTISLADIPDLAPALAVTAACCHGAVFTDIQRLRLKESDRVASILRMLIALGGRAEAGEDTMTVEATGLTGGTVDPGNDHRIAMAAAIAATACREPVTVTGAECAEKSYPRFFEEYRRLGGNYEQHLR